MIKRFLLVLTALVFITGCAGTKERMAAHDAQRRASEYEMLEVRQKVAEINCTGKEKCDLLFRIASDVILETSDMKIQNSSQNHISTYNPTQPGRIGISARRLLASGGDEKITFNAICADRYNSFEQFCNKGLSIVYRTYLIKLNEQGFNIK